ncbi:MAG TPA: undecaprenyl-diphosphatase UppP [Myxococcales bacterium]|jgi:undecaprenyl-diphosphatase|nr:undecaprenyl-diphosphatase UppP [Myxococcales bacterium]
MPIAQAIVLGVVQGLAEFLPISSSAHLILVPWLFGWQDPGLPFDVALHWGTLVAVLVVFWRDWIRLIRAGAQSLLERSMREDPDRRLFWALVVSSVPAALVGKLLNEWAKEGLRAPLLIAVTMSAMAIVLGVADRYGSKRRNEGEIRMPEALGVGVAQAFALVPGVSRSGSTISVGLVFGFTREAIARFSFLMSTPIIFGAGVLEFPQMLREMRAGTSPVGPVALLAGFVASGVVGAIVIRWLLAWVRTRTYTVFVVYRLLVAVLIVAVWLSGKR